MSLRHPPPASGRGFGLCRFVGGHRPARKRAGRSPPSSLCEGACVARPHAVGLRPARLRSGGVCGRAQWVCVCCVRAQLGRVLCVRAQRVCVCCVRAQWVCVSIVTGVPRGTNAVCVHTVCCACGVWGGSPPRCCNTVGIWTRLRGLSRCVCGRCVAREVAVFFGGRASAFAGVRSRPPRPSSPSFAKLRPRLGRPPAVGVARFRACAPPSRVGLRPCAVPRPAVARCAPALRCPARGAVLGAVRARAPARLLADGAAARFLGSRKSGCFRGCVCGCV